MAKSTQVPGQTGKSRTSGLSQDGSGREACSASTGVWSLPRIGTPRWSSATCFFGSAGTRRQAWSGAEDDLPQPGCGLASHGPQAVYGSGWKSAVQAERRDSLVVHQVHHRPLTVARPIGRSPQGEGFRAGRAGPGAWPALPTKLRYWLCGAAGGTLAQWPRLSQHSA